MDKNFSSLSCICLDLCLFIYNLVLSYLPSINHLPVQKALCLLMPCLLVRKACQIWTLANFLVHLLVLSPFASFIKFIAKKKNTHQIYIKNSEPPKGHSCAMQTFAFKCHSHKTFCLSFATQAALERNSPLILFYFLLCSEPLPLHDIPQLAQVGLGNGIVRLELKSMQIVCLCLWKLPIEVQDSTKVHQSCWILEVKEKKT